MRRLGVVVAMLLAFARDAASQALYIGVRAGQNSAWHQGERGQRLIGSTAGVSATFELGPWASLQSEVLYTEKGRRNDGSLLMRAQFIEVPLLLRFASPTALLGVHPFVLGGIARSREVACSGYYRSVDPRINSVGPVTGPILPLNCDDYRAEKRDASQLLSGGVIVRRARGQISLEYRRVYGTRDLTRYYGTPYSTPRPTNDVASLIVGAAMRVR